jgi:tRNA (cytidine/uridine-2'-O-)-methyltransferase
VELYRYKNIESFFETHHENNFVILSSKGKKVYWDYSFSNGDFLIFGRETEGLPGEILSKYHNKSLSIPQYNNKVRCLNLANAVSIVLYEAIRQTGNIQDKESFDSV